MNIVVTGASRGIGFETVCEFSAAPENRIIALSRNGERLHALKDKCSANGRNNVITLQADLADPDTAAIISAVADLGHIDILVNNAGSLVNKSFDALEVGEWRKIFEVNVFGVVGLIKTLLPHFSKNGSAHIVNIGSMGGLQGTSKFHGLTAYSASKAAIANLTECLAEELKELKISVNCLALGSVNTEMLGEAFPGFKAPTNADEVAKFIAWFSAHAGRLMNGKIVPISVNTP